MNDNSPSQHFNPFAWLRLSFGLLLTGAGCQSDFFENKFDSVVEGDDLHTVSRVSTKHNNSGLRYFAKGKVAKAESHFQRALNSDPRSAAAHNNVGNMHLARRELYQAAWEFQRASELAPNRIEPLINLGLVHEEADRLEEAADYYRQALEIAPNDAIATGNLARTLIKMEANPGDVNPILRHLIFVDSRPDWIQWAEELLATRYRQDFFPFESNQSFPGQNDPSDSMSLSPQQSQGLGSNSGTPPESLPNVNVSPVPMRQELLPAPVVPDMVAPPIQLPEQASFHSAFQFPPPPASAYNNPPNNNAVLSAAFESVQQQWPIYPSGPVLEGKR